VIPWINFVVLVISSVLFAVFYVKSVGPAALEGRIGPSAYQRCATYRLVSSIFMCVAAVNYVLYYWFPLPVPLPRSFPWPWWVSAGIAALIGVPSLSLMLRGVRDAGEETSRRPSTPSTAASTRRSVTRRRSASFLCGGCWRSW